jgi:hypothetical protein
MVGVCYNCGTKPILMLFRAGDPSAPQDCPVCGNWHSVHTQRLATDDEFPEGLTAAQASPPTPEAPHVNPDFAECWQSGWRAGWHAHGGISVGPPETEK